MNTVKPFSIHTTFRANGETWVARTFAEVRVIFPVGGRVRRARDIERGIRRAIATLRLTVGVPDRVTSTCLIVLAPNQLGHLNFEKAEEMAVSAVRHGCDVRVVVGSRGLGATELKRLASRLRVGESRILALSEETPGIPEAAAELVARHWRAAAA